MASGWELLRGQCSLVLEVSTHLNKRTINFISITDAIDIATESGRIFFNVMASLAQVDQEFMVERTQAGGQ